MKKKTKAKSKVVDETSLDRRAMLVSLSIGYWEGRKKDKTVTNEVTADANASKDAGAWWTQVIPASAIRPVLLSRDASRAIHMKYTLPWQDDGQRVLPAKMFFKYSEEMRKAASNYRDAVDRFIAAYPEYVRSASDRLGALFHLEYYPKAADLAYRFPWKMRINPLPTAGDFRVDLGSDMTGEIQKSVQDQADAAMRTAMSDLWNRLHSVVSKIAEKLSDSESKFRDSLIENAVELCELLPQMNVTNDSSLDDMRREVIEKLTKQEPDVLRKNKAVRADAAKSANDILKQMTSIMGVKH